VLEEKRGRLLNVIVMERRGVIKEEKRRGGEGSTRAPKDLLRLSFSLNDDVPGRKREERRDAAAAKSTHSLALRKKEGRRQFSCGGKGEEGRGVF